MTNKLFETKNDLGENILCTVLDTFSYNQNNYMIYTDYTLDRSSNILVYGSKYHIDNNTIILDKTSEEEKILINNYWRKQ